MKHFSQIYFQMNILILNNCETPFLDVTKYFDIFKALQTAFLFEILRPRTSIPSPIVLVVS